MTMPPGDLGEDVTQVTIAQDGDATIVVLPPGQSAVYTDDGVEQVVTGVLVVEATPGPRGDVGPRGEVGPRGDQGIQGDVGPRGLTGSTGKIGPRGVEGIQGRQGRDGPQGRTGDTGRTGERGPQGIPGMQGDTGARGLPGFDGQDGVGVPGPDGRTAFDLARAAGFKGTESAWLKSLRGERGPKGEKGDRGERGERGVQGERGDVGERGLRGPSGGEGRFGSAGAPGAPGSRWYTDAGVPDPGLGINGDFYLDSVTGDYYEKIGGVWVFQGNLGAGGGSNDSYTGLAAEDLAAGDFCYTDGASEIALAVAWSPGNQCTGFVKVASLAGTPATIYWEGQNTSLSALMPGERYYLSDVTPGACTATPVRGAGKFHQYLGRAVTATILSFEAADLIRLAS